MKLIHAGVLLGTAFFSIPALADVTIRLHKDLEAVVVDGKALGFSLGRTSEVTVPNGMNQVVVRVAKLIPHQGEFEKFNSDPVVVTFNASDTTLDVAPTLEVTTETQAERFDRDPKVVVSQQGQSFEVHQGVLMRTPGWLRNYEADLAQYNKEHHYRFGTGDVTTAVQPSLQVDGQQVLSVDTQQPQPLTDFAPVTDFSAPMQAMYLQMTPEQRQAFLSWAVQHVNSD